MQKTVTTTVPTYVTNMVQKDTPQKCFLGFFRSLGPKAPQAGPKDSPRDPQGSNLIKKGVKTEARIMILFMLRLDWGGKPTVVPPSPLRFRLGPQRDPGFEKTVS